MRNLTIILIILNKIAFIELSSLITWKNEIYLTELDVGLAFFSGFFFLVFKNI